MPSTIEMHRQDMIELYQLLKVYRGTYPDKRKMTDLMLIDIESRYQKIYNGHIASERNPRGAGRRTKYAQDTDDEILRYRADGFSYRQIANKCGCSLNHVQGVIKKQVY